MKDPYKTLKVNRSASLDEIQAAYRVLAKKHHPDRNIGNPKAAERFKEIQAAWELLSDPERRARFDATGDTEEPKDTVENAILPVLAQLLRETVAAVDANWPADVNRVDLVGEMARSLARHQEKLKQQRLNAQKTKAKWAAIAERIVNLDGSENTLQRVAQDAAAQAEGQLQGVEQLIELNIKATAYLKKFGYTIDVRGGKAVRTLTSMGVEHLMIVEDRGGGY